MSDLLSEDVARLTRPEREARVERLVGALCSSCEDRFIPGLEDIA